jgi:8-amino-7-oxononanoate synthase
LNYILKHKDELRRQIKRHQAIVNENLGIRAEGLIIPIDISDNRKVMQIQAELMKENYLVGAIRQPTVESAIIRLIARLGVSEDDLFTVCNLIKSKIR